MTTPAEGFVPGMRAKGSCPQHPGQPFYHCPECATERKQRVGDQILEEVANTRPAAESHSRSLVTDARPVHFTPRALDHLRAYLRKLKRTRIGGQIKTLEERIERVEGPEREITGKHLDQLRAESDGEEFDIVVRVFLDLTGASGIHPTIEFAEPAKLPRFERDYVRQDYDGVPVAVERQHLNYLRGLIVDWHDRLDRSGFAITHQNGNWCYQDR